MALIKLADATAELRKHGVSPTYFQVAQLCRDGAIPCHRNERRTRWLIDPADIPAIARTFRRSSK